MPSGPGLPPDPAPALVTVTVWGLPARAVPAALVRVGPAGRSLRRVPGLRFARLLGTADARTFAARDTDLRHWVLVGAWDSVEAADGFPETAVARAWSRSADERLDVRLRPLSSRGRWAGREPFTPLPGAEREAAAAAPVAAITRARVRASLWRRFTSAVPPVAADLRDRPGVRLAMGIGEAPVGFQGTFSVWDSAEAMSRFAYRDPAHARVVADTARLGWYAEELFARFAVLGASGTYRGRGLDLPPADGSAG